MSSLDSLDFSSLEEISLPVKVAGKEYILKEASGKAVVDYRNARMACTAYGAEGKLVSIRNLASVEPLLVSLCLFEKTSDGKLKPVPQAVIQSWPSRIQTALFERINTISLMNETPQERKQLDLALALPSSPITLQALQTWVGELSSDFNALKEWIGPAAVETEVKNSQSGTEDGLN